MKNSIFKHLRPPAILPNLYTQFHNRLETNNLLTLIL